MARHKYDPDNWKLVDVDNFMKGNPFLIDWDNELGNDIDKIVLNEDNSINSFIQINQTEYEKIKNDIDSVDKEKILPITKENLNNIINYFSKKLFQLYSNNFDIIKLAFLNGKIRDTELTSLLELLNNDYAKYDSMIKELYKNFVGTLKKVYKNENLNVKPIFGQYYEGLKELIKNSNQEIQDLVPEEIDVPLDERLLKLKELYEATLSKYKKTEQNTNTKDESLNNSQEDDKKKKGKKEKDLSFLKTTWPRIEKDPFSEVIKELGEEEYGRQLKEIMSGPKENENVI